MCHCQTTLTHVILSIKAGLHETMLSHGRTIKTLFLFTRYDSKPGNSKENGWYRTADAFYLYVPIT